VWLLGLLDVVVWIRLTPDEVAPRFRYGRVGSEDKTTIVTAWCRTTPFRASIQTSP